MPHKEVEDVPALSRLDSAMASRSFKIRGILGRSATVA
eukprot:CAMPEP_0197682128 /NCGR_PEP_ID=MMETSP1338-20131121/96025_1 /TAXON_ID=43686 ORGANISM="Pelagodinium beii, Strain RCC1491" /NCGR_SAMPLE_ID=MMETSP1338 /ASSEMBLY_ACC=CAM_ASM_000754 /LENGTH=37 /DNA_ID= /DNA_START= /DNA_END= /DNA_ORIENTATION=